MIILNILSGLPIIMHDLCWCHAMTLPAFTRSVFLPGALKSKVPLHYQIGHGHSSFHFCRFFFSGVSSENLTVAEWLKIRLEITHGGFPQVE